MGSKYMELTSAFVEIVGLAEPLIVTRITNQSSNTPLNELTNFSITSI